MVGKEFARVTRSWAVLRSRRGDPSFCIARSAQRGSLVGIAFLAASAANAFTTKEKDELYAMRAELNKRLPRMIDDVTRLDRIEISDDGFTYFETVLKPDGPDAIKTRVRPNLVKGICSNNDTLGGLRAGIVMHYVYSDSAGKRLGDIVVTSADCPS